MEGAGPNGSTVRRPTGGPFGSSWALSVYGGRKRIGFVFLNESESLNPAQAKQGEG